MNHKKTAVVLFNLGGPSTPEEIKPFLLSLFSDPAIITLPQPFRSLLASFITNRRLKEAQHIYAQLGGGSPLLKNTKAQATALETELGSQYKVFVAMRHAAPFIESAFRDVQGYGPDEVVLLPLYPQYSTTTTESSWREWKRVSMEWSTPTRFISSYPTQNGFLEAIKELTLPLYRNANTHGIPRVLLTAHSLPEKTIKKGDPYQQHVEESAQELILKLGIASIDAVLCYQSRVGPLKWIGPTTENEIIKASQENRPLVIVPLSFVSEHSETLVELDITYKKLALDYGCPAYYRVPTVQTHPLFIQGLGDVVRGGVLLEKSLCK
ncbi:MAG: ferrochelatase [Alphaproteobacteria bacterium]|nr:ferrochelatase [Alphaproteobacteria bacterium]